MRANVTVMTNKLGGMTMHLRKNNVALITKTLVTFVISLSFMCVSALAAGYSGSFYNGGSQFVAKPNGVTAAMTLTGNKQGTGEGYPTSAGTTTLPISYDKWKSDGNTQFLAHLDISNNSGSAQAVNQEIRLTDLSTRGVYISDADKDKLVSKLKDLTSKIQVIRIYLGNGDAVSYTSASTDSDWNNLKAENWNGGFAIQITTPDGTTGNKLADKDTISLSIPLTVSDPTSESFSNFKMIQFSFEGLNLTQVNLNPSFAKEVKDTVNNKPYLATQLLSRDPSGWKYQVLPDDVQALLPTAKDNPVIFDPFGVGFENARTNQNAIPSFNAGTFYVNNLPIFNVVSKYGWSMEYVNNGGQEQNTMYSHYTYTWDNGGSNGPSFVDDQGKELPLTGDNYADYVSLRKVLDAKDWQMDVNGKFDASQGFEQWIKNNSTITDLDAAQKAGLKIDDSQVNTSKAGVYPVTFTVPDAKFDDGNDDVQKVSKTVNVTVLTPNSYILKGSEISSYLDSSKYYVDVMYRTGNNDKNEFKVDNLTDSDLSIQDNSGNTPSSMTPGQTYKVILTDSGRAKIMQQIKAKAGNDVKIDSALNDAYFTYTAPAANTVIASLSGSSTNKDTLDPSDYKVTFTGDAANNHAAYTPVANDLQLQDSNGNVVTNPVAGESYNVVLTAAGNKHIADLFGSTIKVITSGNGIFTRPTTSTGGSGTSTPTTPTGTTSSSSSSSSSTTANSSSQNSSSATTQPGTATEPSTSVAVKGEAVYATKKIGLYKKADFKGNNRIKWYSKAKRVNRPEFIVKGYQKDTNGKLRYRVQQYNPYTRKYVKGTKGYITSSTKYVVPAYYQTVPKSKKIMIINRNGVKSYKRASLTSKVRNYKKGSLLKVKKVVKYKYSTRYVLSNGQYITANKKFVIQK